MGKRRTPKEMQRDRLDGAIHRIAGLMDGLAGADPVLARVAASPEQVEFWKEEARRAVSQLRFLEAALSGERLHICMACARNFVAARRDASYCSGACRQRAHRRRNRKAVTPP
jgi:hypothetical protein